MTTHENALALLEQSLRDALHTNEPVDFGRRFTPIDAVAIYRILLGRNPDLEAELPSILRDGRTLGEFLTSVLGSPEYGGRSGFFPPGHLLMSEVEGFRFWFDTADREMGALMALGRYEQDEVQLMKRLIRPGMRCLDVGAQTGFYTCLMASLVGPAGHVYAFEPMPASYALLTRNIQENGFQDRVIARRLACSDETTIITAARVSGMYVAGYVEGSEVVKMAAVRADDVVQGRVDLVKIDIEGHEPSALGGMQRLIETHRPIVVSECNEYWLRTCSDSSANEYVSLLNSLGYEVFDVRRVETALDAASLTLAPAEVVNVVALPAGDARIAALA